MSIPLNDFNSTTPTIIKPGQGLVYMKVGTHATESLDDIVSRKRKEIAEAGLAFWGYGGGTCHPENAVQPFAKAHECQGSVIYLCMQPMTSNHFAEPVRAIEYSEDRIDWKQVPSGVNVLGSQYALLIRSLQKEEFTLDLSKTSVSMGSRKGTRGSSYIRGRVDKACLEIAHQDATEAPVEKIVPIGLVAELVAPYAVYLRYEAA